MGNKSARKYETPQDLRAASNKEQWQRPMRREIDVMQWLGNGVTIGSHKGI